MQDLVFYREVGEGFAEVETSAPRSMAHQPWMSREFHCGGMVFMWRIIVHAMHGPWDQPDKDTYRM